MPTMWQMQLAREIRESQHALRLATASGKKKAKRRMKKKIKIPIPPYVVHNGKERVRHFRLYALRLEGDKYYVGMTAQKAVARFSQHQSGKGAVWTKLYKPIEILEVREVGLLAESHTAVLESNMTLEYMKRYGTDHVRGGKWCQVKLKDKVITKIELLY